MKTILTLLIAVLAFATTLAWAGDKPVTEQPSAAQSASAPAKSGQHSAGAKRAPGGATRSTQRASDFKLELPAGPSVICACVVDKSLG